MANRKKTSSKCENNANTQIDVHNIDTCSLSEESKTVVALIINHINEVMKVKDEQIAALEKTVTSMQEKIRSLEIQIDSNSAYDRRDTLVLSGDIPESRPDENCKEIVRDVIKNQARLIIHENDISTAHRLGRKPENSNRDKRSIIFKLCRHDTKREIMSACKVQKPSFYINEHLTPTRGTIMFALRKARQMDPTKIGAARSHEGNISVFIPSEEEGRNGRRMACNTRSALDEILQDHLGITSQQFVNKWP